MGKNKKKPEELWLTTALTPNELSFFKKRKVASRLRRGFYLLYSRHDGIEKSVDGRSKYYSNVDNAPWRYSQVKLSIDEINELVKRTYGAGFDDIDSIAALLTATPVSNFKTQVPADDGQGVVDAIFVRRDGIELTVEPFTFPEDGVSGSVVLTPLVDVYMDYHCINGCYLVRIMRADTVIGGELKFVTIFTDLLASKLDFQKGTIRFFWECQEQGSMLLRTYLAVQFAALNDMLVPAGVRRVDVPREDGKYPYIPTDVRDYALSPKYLVQTPRIRAKKPPVVLYEQCYRPEKEV